LGFQAETALLARHVVTGRHLHGQEHHRRHDLVATMSGERSIVRVD